jgi:hypothetical protein
MHGNDMGLALAGLLDQVAELGLGFPNGNCCAHVEMVTHFDQKSKSKQAKPGSSIRQPGMTLLNGVKDQLHMC